MPDELRSSASPPPEDPAEGRAVRGERLSALPAAARYLLAQSPPPARDAVRAARVVAWVVPAGLLIGILWAGAFRGAWRLYGEIDGLRMVPGLAVVLLEALLTGRFLWLAVARAADGPLGPSMGDDERLTRNPSLRACGAMAIVLCAMVQWVLVVSIPHVTPWWPPPDDWRSAFNFLYPRPIYRPLILAPLWGRWAILMAAATGRTAPGVDAMTASLCRSMGPRRVLLHALLPVVLTCIYFSRERNFLIGGVISLFAFASSYLAAQVLARRNGGQDRVTLFAAGQIGQIAFLAIYRALWPRIYL